VDDRQQTSDPGPADESEAGEPARALDAEPRSRAVPAVAPPSIVDGEEHSVDPRSVKVARIIGVPLTLLIAMAPLLFITLGWALGGIPSSVYVPLLLGLLVLLALPVLFAYKWPAARHERLRYLVDEGGLRIRRGVLWRKVIWIPISRVQHTDVSQGPVQRSFGLATLTVHTAGTAGASISLAGLEHGIATRLCDHLRPDRATDAD
jgi:membrane protein YdbS with pleckstrin-like domain